MNEYRSHPVTILGGGLGAQLRVARKRRRLSLRALAGVSGLSPTQIVRTEAGRHVPRVETLRKLASALRAEVTVGPDETHVELLP